MLVISLFRKDTICLSKTVAHLFWFWIFPLERNLQYSSPQCNRIGEEFNFKSVREKSDERYGFNRSRKTMPGSDGVDTPGRSYWSESKSGWGSPDEARKVGRWIKDGNLSESYESYGNAGGRICHPMAVGEMWLPRTAIRRRQETLPPVRHPTAPEPLMLHSAKRWKGKGSRIHRFLGLSSVYQGPIVIYRHHAPKVVIWYCGNCY